MQSSHFQHQPRLDYGVRDHKMAWVLDPVRKSLDRRQDSSASSEMLKLRATGFGLPVNKGNFALHVSSFIRRLALKWWVWQSLPAHASRGNDGAAFNGQAFLPDLQPDRTGQFALTEYLDGVL
jgi:hypothetical protein